MRFLTLSIACLTVGTVNGAEGVVPMRIATEFKSDLRPLKYRGRLETFTAPWLAKNAQSLKSR